MALAKKFFMFASGTIWSQGSFGYPSRVKKLLFLKGRVDIISKEKTTIWKSLDNGNEVKLDELFV